MRTIEFAKGHGTRNDFVLFVDRDGLIELSDAEVAFICDRRAGIGADGILRAVDSALMPGYSGQPGEWFMDYRNADGSVAEMCGNGLRVFLRYLAEEGLVDASAPVTVGTRAGRRTGQFLADGRVAVTMGTATTGEQVEITLDGRTWPATAVDVGNPHAVVRLEPGTELAALPLAIAPVWEPARAFPNGVNTEFVLDRAPGVIQLRVYERGVGETQSCGTGVVAAAAVSAPGGTCHVHVPGGELDVDLTGAEAILTGPAEIIARGRLNVPRGSA
ncbi:MAG: diaminopimelate epimerase [Propionibacteriales bacterium]|nr:diaminopimelate epimerase [Propionibacteriales bacterium]